MPATLPVWKANGTAASGTGAITVNAPTGHAAGDFLVLAVNSSNQAVATPSGWNSFGGSNGTGTGTAATADSCALHLFWRIATGTGQTAAIADSGDHTLGVITSFTGVSTVNPIETIAWQTKSTNSTSDTFPAITTVGPNRLVVAVVSTGQESVKSSPTFAGLGSFTARGVGTTTSGVDGGIAMFSGTKVAAGSTGTGTVTESITSKGITATFALKPANFEQTVTPTGIASAQAIGTPQVNGGNVVVAAPSLGGIYVGLAASFQLYASGGNNSYTWTLTSGSVPGMSLATNGLYDGSPTTGGTYSVTVRATDGLGAWDEHTFDVVVTDFGINDAYDVVTYVGDGASTKTVSTSIDLSSGGWIYVARTTSAAAENTGSYISADGSTIYCKVGSTALDANPVTASSAAFDNGSFTVDQAVHNVSGATYVAHIFRKHVLVCDIVTATGDGGTNRALSHNLGAMPGLIALYGSSYQWWTGYTKDEYGGWCNGMQYKQGGVSGIWGTTNRTSTQFYIGGSATNNVSGRTLVYVVFPESSPFLQIGAYTGNASNPRTDAIATGWPVQTLFLSQAFLQAVYSTIHDDEFFTGNDQRYQLSSYVNDNTSDAIEGTAAGITVKHSTTNTAATSYTFMAVRAPTGTTLATLNGITSAEAFGSPTVTTSMHSAPLAYPLIYQLAYSADVDVVGGASPYTFSHLSGTLPTGVSFSTVDANTYRFSGTPTAIGSYTFTIRTVDNNAVVYDKVYTLTVEQVEDYVQRLAWTGDGASSRYLPLRIKSDAGAILWLGRTEPGGTPTRYAQGPLTAAAGGVFNTLATFALHADGAGLVVGGHNTNDTGVLYEAVLVRAAPRFAVQADYLGTWNGNAASRLHPHTLGEIPTLSLVAGEVLHIGMGSVASAFHYQAPAANPDAGAFLSFPTATQFELNDSIGNLSPSPYDAALFADQPTGGLVRVGTYTGNGSSSGPTVTVGFEPQSVVVLSPTQGRAFLGTKSNPLSGATDALYGDDDPTPYIDGGLVTVTSTSFTLTTDNAQVNENGTTHYYIAFRASPTPAQDSAVTGIASAQAMGSPTVLRGAVTRPVTGIASAQAFGSPKINRTVPLTGIASAQSFGTPQVNRTAPVTGVASAEAFGSPTFAQGAFTCPVTAVGSAEAFGAPTVSVGAVTRPVSGVASAEAFGTLSVSTGAVVRAVDGVSGAEAFGTPVVARGVVTRPVDSIASAEAFGSPVVNQTGGGTTVVLDGVASAEAFGSPILQRGAVVVVAAGIASAEAFGSPTLTAGAVTRPVTAVASAEAFGSPALARGAVTRQVASIAGAESMGAPAVVRGAVARPVSAVASAEAFGTPALASTRSVALTGVATAEALGAPTVLRGGVSLSITSIASEESLGEPTLVLSGVSLFPTGIASAEAFGAATVLRGGVTRQVTGVASAEAFGVPAVSQLTIIAPAGIASAEALGAPAVQAAASAALTGIASAEAVGEPTALRGTVTRPVTGVATAQALGAPTVRTATTRAVGGVGTAEALGSPTVTTSATRAVVGIASSEAFGTATIVVGGVIVSPASVDSAQAMGALTALAGGVTCEVGGIASDFAAGTPLVQFSFDRTLQLAGIGSEEAFGDRMVMVLQSFEVNRTAARPDSWDEARSAQRAGGSAVAVRTDAVQAGAERLGAEEQGALRPADNSTVVER